MATVIKNNIIAPMDQNPILVHYRKKEDNMFNIIGEATLSRRGKVSSPTLSRLLRQEQESIVTITGHYRQYGRNVDGSHILVKLIYGFTFPIDAYLEKTFATATAHTAELGALIGASTPVNSGYAVESQFYDNCSEYLLSVNDFTYGDVLDLTGDAWKDLVPVRVLYQPYKLPLYYLPTGGHGSGYHAVMAIDIPMLAVMFVAWARENRKLPVGSRATVEHFVGRYILPNMLVSQFNSCLSNHIIEEAAGDVSRVITSTSPRHVVSYDKDIYKEYALHLDKLLVKDLTPSEFAANCPSLIGEIPLLSTTVSLGVLGTQANYTVRFIATALLVNAVLLFTMSNRHMHNLRPRVKSMLRLNKNRGTVKRITGAPIRELMSDTVTLIASITA